MPDRKVLKGIKPFNRFLFISCYYHQLIAAYSYFGLEPEVQLSNYYPVYLFNAKESGIKVSMRSVNGKPVMEKMTGVRETVKHESKDIVDEAIDSVQEGSPVIIAVDAFYLPYRETAYQKAHLPHYLLIYGYDDEKSEFIVSDHMHLNSYQYTERFLGYGDLRKAYEGYIQNFYNTNKRVIVKFRKTGEAQTDRGNFSRFFESVQKRFDSNITVINKIARHVAENIDGIWLNPEMLNTYAVFFGKLNQIKMSQGNVFRYYDAVNSERAELCRAAADAALFISSVICKLRFTKTMAGPLKQKVVQKLEDIIDAEKGIVGSP